MTLRYMLDTNVVSYIVKGRPPEYRRRWDGAPVDQLCVSAITRAELVYGLTALPDHSPTRRSTELLLGTIAVLDWPASAADQFARIKRSLSETGTLIDDMDLMIAAHALDAGLILVTDNVRHFGRVSGLVVVNWRESPAS